MSNIPKALIDKSYLSTIITNTGESLAQINERKPILLVFLRHFGCIFCREALYDIANLRDELEAAGLQVVFVHMTDYTVASKYLTKYELADVPHISDEACQYYQDFGLTKGNFSQLFGLMSWVRGAEATLLKGQNFIAKELGDGFQMPGVFLLKDNDLLHEFVHQKASDKPDYKSFITYL